MKLKYYLRGLGIGVLVTAIILHFILGDGTSPMTDEQVKARAKELGMKESMTLSQAAYITNGGTKRTANIFT